MVSYKIENFIVSSIILHESRINFKIEIFYLLYDRNITLLKVCNRMTLKQSHSLINICKV